MNQSSPSDPHLYQILPKTQGGLSTYKTKQISRASFGKKERDHAKTSQ